MVGDRSSLGFRAADKTLLRSLPLRGPSNITHSITSLSRRRSACSSLGAGMCATHKNLKTAHKSLVFFTCIYIRYKYYIFVMRRYEVATLAEKRMRSLGPSLRSFAMSKDALLSAALSSPCKRHARLSRHSRCAAHARA